MNKLTTSLFSGFVFAIGLGVSGMTRPQRVIGFLDVFGNWNPSLAFVMIGAIAVHSLSYFYIKNKTSPVLDPSFHVPKNNKSLDSKLLIGAATFGIGWGLGGFCPGPAITSLASGASSVVSFVLSMIVGIAIFKLIFEPKSLK
jgi:uncharacterized membrane protein YedE/YeeE